MLFPVDHRAQSLFLEVGLQLMIMGVLTCAFFNNHGFEGTPSFRTLVCRCVCLIFRTTVGVADHRKEKRPYVLSARNTSLVATKTLRQNYGTAKRSTWYPPDLTVTVLEQTLRKDACSNHVLSFATRSPQIHAFGTQLQPVHVKGSASPPPHASRLDLTFDHSDCELDD